MTGSACSPNAADWGGHGAQERAFAHLQPPFLEYHCQVREDETCKVSQAGGDAEKTYVQHVNVFRIKMLSEIKLTEFPKRGFQRG
jgi:hypothetical protein